MSEERKAELTPMETVLALRKCAGVGCQGCPLDSEDNGMLDCIEALKLAAADLIERMVAGDGGA